jgi:hypothetical protein
MPRGARLGDPTVIEKRIQKRAENRKEMNGFFVYINDTLRVARDNYNVILFSKRKADSGRMYAFPEGYFSTPEAVVTKAKERGATEKEITAYLERVKGIKVTFDFGDLVMTLPETFKPDIPDLTPAEEEE